MKRQAIRSAIDAALADRGFRRGWYGWQGCALWSYTESGTGSNLGRFPSGMSRKRLTAALASIEPIGPSRPAPQFEKADTYRQTDISEFTGEGRR